MTSFSATATISSMRPYTPAAPNSPAGVCETPAADRPAGAHRFRRVDSLQARGEGGRLVVRRKRKRGQGGHRAPGGRRATGAREWGAGLCIIGLQFIGVIDLEELRSG